MTSGSERHEQLRTDLESLGIDRDSVAPPPRRRRTRHLGRWFVLLVALLAAIGVATVMTRPLLVTTVTAVAVPAGDAQRVPLLSGSGYVVTGDRYVSIGVRVPGRIDRYFVEEGQSVHKGDPLVQLDDRDYRAVVSRVEAGLQLARANQSLAETELRRGRTLHEQGVVSKDELDVLENKATVARATIAQLTADLAQARVNLEYTLLRAPTDGVVLAKLKEVGEIAVPGGFAGSGDLVRLANLTDMRAEVDVNEADLNRVRMGQSAEVTPDAYPDKSYAAEVVKMYPQVDRQKGTLKVEVHILEPDTQLLPDMSARISFLADHASTDAAQGTMVLVPAAAVGRDAQGNSFVWILRAGRARRTTVTTAGDVGDQVRLRNGLAVGEAVIVSPLPSREGQRVRATTAAGQ